MFVYIKKESNEKPEMSHAHYFLKSYVLDICFTSRIDMKMIRIIKIVSSLGNNQNASNDPDPLLHY